MLKSVTEVTSQVCNPGFIFALLFVFLAALHSGWGESHLLVTVWVNWTSGDVCEKKLELST